MLELVFEGDFKAVLFSSAVRGLLGGPPEEGDSIETWLERQVLSYLSNDAEDQRNDRWAPFHGLHGFLSVILN